MPRSRRLAVLAKLLSGRGFSSQEELARALGREGHEVTQATLSRDLRGLGVIRRPDPDGRPVYELPGPPLEQLDRQRRDLDLKAFVNEVKVAQNIAVVITPPGHAMGVGRAIDLRQIAGVVGSVAGDDTILVVLEDAAAARRFKRQLDALAGHAAGAGK